MGARIGSISFVNSLPVDWGLLSGQIPYDGEVIQDVPSKLNNKLVGGEIDLAPVSALWFAKYSERLALLPRLSISSESGVQSVLLFTRHPLNELRDGARVFFSGNGRTTPALLQILCRFKYGFHVEIEQKNTPVNHPVSAVADGALIIGDDALRARREAPGFQVTDLAEEWRAWTGLPLVFAVWAVRRSYLAESTDQAAAAYRAVLASRRWGMEHPDSVLNEAMNRLPIGEEALRSYFSALSYGFDDRHRESMALFFDYALKLGLLDHAPSIEEAPMALAEAGTGSA